MNHRQRLIAALSHRQPDRVPIDIGGTVNSSIVVEGYAKLKQHYGINSEDELCNRMTRTVKVEEEILQALDIDTRGVFMGAPIKFAMLFSLWASLFVLRPNTSGKPEDFRSCVIKGSM